jgi:hypothetical protein
MGRALLVLLAMTSSTTIGCGGRETSSGGAERATPQEQTSLAATGEPTPTETTTETAVTTAPETAEAAVPTTEAAPSPSAAPGEAAGPTAAPVTGEQPPPAAGEGSPRVEDSAQEGTAPAS